MKYIINLEKLRFGDILLTRTNDRTCLKIREYSNSNYSHALIYKGNKSCLESNAFGVQSINPQRLIFASSDDLIVLRLKEFTSIFRLETGLNNASKKIGMGYASRNELMKSYLDTLEKSNESNRQFCTRFVAQTYHESGLLIVENADYCSPKHLEESALFNKITDILCEGSKEEIELALDENNVVDIQTESTYNFLKNVRELTKMDIQTFEDVEKFLLDNNEYDEGIDILLKETQYLNLGDLEKNINPSFYNAELFLVNLGYPKAYETARDEIGGELVRIYNFEQAINKYESIFNETGLSYFKSHMDCYKRQLEIAKVRLNVFIEILK